MILWYNVSRGIYMVKSICKDLNILMKKSVDANLLDLNSAKDLEDNCKKA